MSTLSELLPAGSGGKNVDFVASGTLTNGQTVALKSDGKVEAVGTTSQAIGATNQWATSNNTSPSATAYGSVYDPDSQRVVVAYYDGNDNYYGYCVVGEVDPSNNTITFGTQVLFQSNFIIPHSIGYDTTNDKIVVFFQNVNSSSHGQARVGTFTGSTLSFPGSQTTFNSGSTEDITAVFNPDQGTFLVVYKDNGASGLPYGAVGTVSGTSISFGSETQLDSNGTSFPALTYNTTTSSYVMVYNKTSVTQQVYYQVPTTSGTTVTAGTPTLMTLNGSTTGQAEYTNLSSDNASNTVFLTFRNSYNSNHGSAIAATLSGSTLTFGTEVVFNANTTYGVGAVYDTTAQKLVVSYADTNQYGIVVAASVSGTTLTFGSPTTFRNASTNAFTNAYDSVNKKVVVTYYEQNTGYAGSVVFQPESSNASGFIGITDAAIADTATGSVTIKGGIGIAQATSQSNSLGSAQLFNDGTTNYSKVVYDSNSDRIVVIFADNSNLNYGTAIVGEVSGSSVQYGTKEVFNTGTASYMDITFDSNSNRVVIAFTGTPANEYGTAIVGSVDPSDNSIDFGTASVYKSATCSFNTCTFDSSNNKVVVGYRIYPSPQGIARVGTVDPSDNSISFTGAESVYVNGDLANQSSTFDSSNNKVVITFQDGTNTGRGTAIVGTVSGTGISFGSKVDFSGANNTNYSLPVTFDSNSNKIVVLYSGPASTYLGRAKVGTISGTAITFGSEATFEPSNVVRYKAIAFDSTANKVIIVYDENQTDLKYVVGTVSGTDITFETPTIFSTSNGVGDGSLDVAYDSSINRSVFAFRDESNSNKGTSQVLALAGILENLTPNNVYYVQSDGTISTNSAGTRIGKALSTTSINLEFNS
jgi:hypothetical protein